MSFRKLSITDHILKSRAYQMPHQFDFSKQFYCKIMEHKKTKVYCWGKMVFCKYEAICHCIVSF